MRVVDRRYAERLRRRGWLVFDPADVMNARSWTSPARVTTVRILGTWQQGGVTGA